MATKVNILATIPSIPTKILNSGYKMPMMAIGTWNLPTPEKIIGAIEVGYMHIDTNPPDEPVIAEAIKYAIHGGLATREDLFIAAKLSENHFSPQEVVESLKKSLARLQLEYVDLFLMNDLRSVDVLETWRGMEQTVKLNMSRSIGVTNLTLNEFDRIWERGNVKISNVQVEVNPRQAREGLVSYTQDLNIVVSAYSPLAGIFSPNPPGPRKDDPLLLGLSEKYKKSVPQILLRYLIERDVAPLLIATLKNWLIEDIEIFDFRLTSAEVDLLTITYNKNEGVAGWKTSDDWAEEAARHGSC